MTHYPRPPVTPETRVIKGVHFLIQEAASELMTAIEWKDHPECLSENVALALKPLKAAVRELEAMLARVKIEEMA